MPTKTTTSTATVTTDETTIRQGLLRGGAAAPWPGASPGCDDGAGGVIGPSVGSPTVSYRDGVVER
jgi:hypothetical protein